MVRGRRGFCIPVKRLRKLSRRLFAILEDDLAAIVDTYLQARAFEEAVGQDLIPLAQRLPDIEKGYPPRRD
jgi:hypothetical protein